MRLGLTRLISLGIVALLVGGTAGPAVAAFPQDPPNDPNYAPAEQSPTVGVNDEQWYLYSFMPANAPLASDPENAAGMSVDAAWRNFSIGSPDTVIAYVEAGINWHTGGVREIADKVYVNRDEMAPCMSEYKDNKDPWFNALDFPATPDANSNGYVDAEDLIVACSDGKDDDHNGYTDDISGWDFYNGQNDPATLDATYGHSVSQMTRAAALTNNGIGGAGVCPLCMLLPVKGGAEALDRPEDLAQAWIFAADAGADVVVSETAALGYSSFLQQAAEYVAHSGSVLLESSNDFNSTDHQGGMWHPHSVPGNGVVSDRAGLDQSAGPLATGALADRTITTYRARSGETSWGTHNMFSFASIGGSTSESSGVAGGVLGLVMSYGREAAKQGLIARKLTGFEVQQVLRATASDIDDPSLPWPGKPGWDVQYGYGRPNVDRALRAIRDGAIPPVGTIEGPRWFSLFDPTTEDVVPIEGIIEAPRAPGKTTWRLEAGLGAEPSEFFEVGAGAGEGRIRTALDLKRIPESFWRAPFALSRTKALETTERYTVTLRLRVTDAAGRIGEDRRTIFVQHDDTVAPGFPMRIGPGGEGVPALVDLNGDGKPEIVFGDSDGRMHAIDPRTTEELPGWPVRTDEISVAKKHPGIDPGAEPVPTNVAVADLDGDGRLEVVATSTQGKTYAWEPDGARRPGWPRALDTGVTKPPIPRPGLQYTRLPIRGAFASPVLEDLDGDSRLEVIQAGWDGYVHAWQPDGSDLAGWPVRIKLPEAHSQPPGRTALVNDQKLDSTPAVADLDGDGRPEIVIRSQYLDVLGGGLQPFAVAHVFALHADGSAVAGWPVEVQQLFGYYGSAQEFITEGSSSVVAADVDGDGRDEIAVSLMFSPTWLLSGDGTIRAAYGPAPNPTFDVAGGQSPLSIAERQLPADIAVSFTTSGAFGRFGPTLAYAEPGSGGGSTALSLLTTGSGVPIRNQMRAFDALAGADRPGFPAFQQGLNFLGSPVFADVTGDGAAEVIGGGDSSAMHAYVLGGAQAAGFPKFTTGWTLWAPTVGDVDGDGGVEVVTGTREGYLFVWKTPGLTTANTEWPRWRHDDRNTGNYGSALSQSPSPSGASPSAKAARTVAAARPRAAQQGTLGAQRVSVQAASGNVAALALAAVAALLLLAAILRRFRPMTR